ncbi:MAG: hypothetical protein ACK4IT_09465 [Thioalkalivibrionaceae bacterium]
MNLKMIKLNNLQYNANRDPAVYRRPVNTDFRLQALLGGSGQAKAKFVVDGHALCEETISLPGAFDCHFRFESAGTRLGELIIENNGSNVKHPIRVDVLEHAPIG